jgi:transposase
MAQPIVKRTWGLVGKTPIFKRRGRSHEKATIIGAIACQPDGSQARFLFRLLPGQNANADRFRLFLDQLLRTIPGKLIVIWDRLSAHRAKSVNRYVRRYRARLQIEFLPAYAPELNPVEQAWAYLKGHRLANFAPESQDALAVRTKRELCRMRRKRQSSLVDAWIKHTPLRW